MANRLIDETSPYLLQHANNPVDWFPWGPEAFEAARERDVPILLSIGYSACHWCHVMERESFEDESIARQMNGAFVNVKVDREERPDIDELYMRAVQALNDGRGGWPLTVFLTPDGAPFYGGTYFPPRGRGGMPGLVDVLSHVDVLWRDRRSDLGQLTEGMVQMLRQTGDMPPPALALEQEWLAPVVSAARDAFDPTHGGLGEAPKFPPHGTLTLLLAHYHVTRDEETLGMVTSTLDGMARGGMYDLLAGGFARYSVDEAWRVPHFEKMLYDNAQLIPVYLDAYRVTGHTPYARVVEQTVGWLLQEMHLEHGGFAASQDADSEGREGVYFVWTPAQLAEVLGDDANVACRLLGVTEAGTFEDGASVLRLASPPDTLSASDREVLDRCLPLLWAARGMRQRPDRDDKVITAWNALTISALARAAGVMGQQVWLDAAKDAATFLLEGVTVDGRLMRTFKAGQARIPAFADDYANLVNALLDLWEATFDPVWLDEATRLADQLITLFWDKEGGGLFYTGGDQDALVARSKHFLGGAEPSANGMAALALVRLGRLLSRDDLIARADHIVRSAQQLLERAPRALGPEALAGAWLARGGTEIALMGDSLDELLAEVRKHPHPFAVLFAGPGPLSTLPWLEGKEAIAGQPTAYVCEGYACQLPVHTTDALAEALEAGRARAPDPTAPDPRRPAAPPLPSEADRWIGVARPPTPDDLSGRVVVLDFWTYCCVNCHHVLPELAKLEAHFEGRPLTVIGVHSAKFDAERQRSNVEAAIARHGIAHPVVLDPDHAIWDAFGVRSWPTLVVLDAQGRIALQRPGEVLAEDLIETLEGLLAEADPETSPLAPAAPTDAPTTTLRFPGKIHVWPDAWEQELGTLVGDAARVYIADTGHHRIVEATISHDDAGWPALTVVRTFGSGSPGLVDGDAETACFNGVQGVRRFQHTLYVADTDNHALRAVDLRTGQVTTLAGNGVKGTGTPEREALAEPLGVPLRSPWSVEIMPFKSHHLVFVAMAGSHQIWVYAADHIGIHAGSGREDHVDGPAAASALAQPSDLALYGRYLLFVDSEVSSIRAVDLQAHQVVTVVGRGLFDFGDVDGPADAVRLQHPLGLTFAGETVFVADTYNHKIKKVALSSGETATLAGGDDALREPSGIARLEDHLLVADTGHHRISAVRLSDGAVQPVVLTYSA